MKESQSKNDKIKEYIKQSIVDIARKCNVYNTDVINVFKKLY